MASASKSVATNINGLSSATSSIQSTSILNYINLNNTYTNGIWNNLSQEDVDAQSINCLKNRLEKSRTWQKDFFKDL